MAVYTGSGTTLALTSAAPSAETKAAYEALAYTEVGEVSDLGELPSRAYEVVPWRNVTDRGEREAKAGYSYTSQTIMVGWNSSDAGQALLDVATDQDAPYTVRISHPSLGAFYGRALVMGGQRNLGDVNTIATRQVTLEYASILEGGIPLGALSFSDGDPLQFSDGSYLELAA